MSADVVAHYVTIGYVHAHLRHLRLSGTCELHKFFDDHCLFLSKKFYAFSILAGS